MSPVGSEIETNNKKSSNIIDDESQRRMAPETIYLWGTLTSATEVFATVSPLIMVCTCFICGDDEKGHILGLPNTASAMEKSMKLQPQILASILHFFILLFFPFHSSFLPRSFLPFVFVLTVLLPSFSYLPLAFCWSQLFLLMPFPCNHQPLNDVPNLQAEELNCRHVHRWTLTMQPKQWHEKTFLCTLISTFLELQPSSHSLPFTRLPPPLCEQVGPSVGPSFGPVCHRSWYQVILCTTLKLCCIWCICINILSCISHWYHSQTHSRSNCTLFSFLSHNQF